MNVLASAVPGLVALLAVAGIFHGYSLLRADPSADLEIEDLALLKGSEQARASGEGPIMRLAGRLTPWLRRRLPLRVVRQLQRQVDLAGRPNGMGVDDVLQRLMMWLLIVSPAAFLFLLQGQLFGVALSVAAVIVMPLARLSTAARKRTEALDRSLPDFLDVLSVSVGAGIAFRPALRMVSERFSGPLAEEFSTVLHQIANGASVRGAFTQLRARNDSEALGEFVTAYLQSEELGAPLRETLTQIAEDMRRSEAQRMRVKAARVAPRVTLISSLVLVPGTLIVLVVGLYLGSEINLGDILG